jgi:hypothetical protein
VTKDWEGDLKLVLTRTDSKGSVTLGRLVVPGVRRALYTLEDPWLDNHPLTSCIPAADYKCAPHGWEPNTSFKFKEVWEVLNVPRRSAILFHAGNTHKDTHGCILVGLSAHGEKVSHSRDAIAQMRRAIGEKGFDLEITDAPVA